ncbi:MAG: hypothetical protein A2664_01715 [Candidatus Taylorbacteria bacterium RIFCSPHIGHO2_01_FULL_46_22b]|uniref:DUF8128 domain-containing protein n=1 Tax=Candidatus Taylorbacteria bacterium RIFCSPHIGHO2_01_FULL_46_22b TaxID=1802301 RepID=A0A1G2M2T3_9BACT|nr:MAG: hypothetical protein A2664_01715 [Candidatus Taylorbacteria bacterium RIFCSPHIGHO2_01_FULL_46_22b]
MESGYKAPERTFNSPEEELAFLRERIAQKERELSGKEPEHAVQETINEYKQVPKETVLAPAMQIHETELSEYHLKLSPEPHDAQVAQLVHLVVEKGIKNALSVVDKLNDPHLADDFERFLVQYVKAGKETGFGSRNPLFRALQMTLYEITLPERDPKAPDKPLKELLSSMEQFYAGMMAVREKDIVGPNYFTLELSVANHSEEFVFYAAVPNSKCDLFEKHIRAVFHDAKISERTDDYNIFNEGGASVGSVARLTTDHAFPIRTYESFDHDPLHALLSSFGKIDKDGEGAAVQIVFTPASSARTDRYKAIIRDLAAGKKLKDALDKPETVGGHVWSFTKDIAKELFGGSDSAKKDEEKTKEPPKVDDISLEQVKHKSESPVADITLRLVASSRSDREATDILSDLESAFNQFDNPHGNNVRFKRFSGGRLEELLRNFSFRLADSHHVMPLSLRELTTVFHLPSTITRAAPELKVAKAGTSAVPVGLPDTGLTLGVNREGGREAVVYMQKEDRLRHFYCIGQTGTGKTTLLKNMIVQDILAGEGVCFIDPHGSDVEDLLACIPPERYNDVVYFDPGAVAHPMGLNMLEFDPQYPEQKTFVVNEMLSIFNKLFDMKTAGGPMFEQYFRNAALLVLEDPESGTTLVDLSRTLSDKTYRAAKLARCKNPIIVSFWREVAEKAGGEAALQNIVPYITSKFDGFLSNDIMRPIIAQEKSAFNFREIMDSKKILLVNLSKGRLGDINSHLLGLILVGKILMAALSRVDSKSQNLPPFYLYVDEFQNVTTDSIAVILSEARKYKLGLSIAHQFIKQLDDKIKDAVFGNVGSIATFRVGAEDAEFLVKQYEPVFSARDIINLDNRHAYLKLLVNGRPIKPFNIETLAPSKGNPAQSEKLKELSYLTYGRPRQEVEAEIIQRYAKPNVSVQPDAAKSV